MSQKTISLKSFHVFCIFCDLDQTNHVFVLLVSIFVTMLITLMCVSARPAQRDELREIFNDISSSSEDEEDEGDRHEDEDLNIMDTEDDLVRQLQDKLNESDSAQHESDRNNQIGEKISGFLHTAGKLNEICVKIFRFLHIHDYLKRLF